jgi:cytochrome c-type biogenesis protein CcmH/NrfG
LKPESFVFAIAGTLFGIIVGWVLGSQQASGVRRPEPVAQQAAAPATTPQPAQLDQARVQELTAAAERNPKDPQPRVQLGNAYFDAERYADAIKWYEEAFALSPKDPDVSTDLGVAYYYTNQADRAIKQFETSLASDAKHTKTLLNLGIVKAFGKQDLEGAAAAWEQVVALAPGTPEGQAAKKALEGMKNAHQNTKPGASGGR